VAGARLVHISTDRVFDGRKGDYTERDPSNAEDLYGKSTFLGEVDYSHAVTLRTSIIGHELDSAHSQASLRSSGTRGGMSGFNTQAFPSRADRQTTPVLPASAGSFNPSKVRHRGRWHVS
jgi:dTDP-4-dehydrorhamnose reductase